MKLHQKNNEYYNAFKKCLAMQGTNLRRFCKANNLNYDNTRYALSYKEIYIPFLLDLYYLAGEEGYVDLGVCLPFINFKSRLTQKGTETITND